MKPEDIRYGQRIRVNVPGLGDHGQVGTVKTMRRGMYSVHMDRDQRPWHVVLFYAADLDLVADELQPDESPVTHEVAVRTG